MVVERKGLMREKKRMISEAAKELGLETYHLRTWEDEFSLNIPRNEKGYRYYGDKEVHTFALIRDMRNKGMGVEEIKSTMTGKVVAFPKANKVSKVDKMEQFQQVMAKIVGKALLEQKDVLSKEITKNVAKEMESQLRLQEDAQEVRFRQLDETIRNQQKLREELAATKERRGFFRRKRRKNEAL